MFLVFKKYEQSAEFQGCHLVCIKKQATLNENIMKLNVSEMKKLINQLTLKSAVAQGCHF